MAPWRRTWPFPLVLAACASPDATAHEADPPAAVVLAVEPAAEPVGESVAQPIAELVAVPGRQPAIPRRTVPGQGGESFAEVPPRCRFASHDHVLVVESFDLRPGNDQLLGASWCRPLPGGAALSWRPVYGAIVDRTK
jgi:hypothetical protein